MTKIFIISGEKSGDIIAEDIISNLKKDFPEVEIKGIGGESFSKNNLQSLFPQKEISIMGFFAILPKIFKLLKLLKATQ